MIEPSPLESARFGLRVGRWNPAAADERVTATDFDVVILRRPSDWVDTWVALTRDEGFTAIHADTLMYWEWLDEGQPLLGTGVLAATIRHDVDDLAGLVRVTFAQYRNHYLANPLFDPAGALDGYVEWAVRTALAGGWIELSDETATVGFAVVDWSVTPPDVRLAGVVPTHQGRGLYPSVVSAVMGAARTSGVDRVVISTQSHNIAAQRTWSSLGWRPFRSTETVHLVRRSLLGPGGTPS